MKNKKLMFSEARFVFMSPEKTPASAPVIALTPEQRARVLREQRADALKASEEKQKKAQVLLKANSLDLGGQTIEIAFGKTSSQAMLMMLSAQVLPVLNSKKNEDSLKVVARVLKLGDVDMKLADLKPIAAKVYAKDLFDKAKEKLDAKYPRLSDYLNAKGIKDAGLKVKLSSGATDLKVELVEGDKDLQKKYEDWKKANPSTDVDKAAAAASKAKGAIPPAELERFSQSPLGKLFKYWKEGDKN
ncbi:MAG: hypothetical protein ABID64_01740, partial [Nitrospirota bacterium]